LRTVIATFRLVGRRLGGTDVILPGQHQRMRKGNDEDECAVDPPDEKSATLPAGDHGGDESDRDGNEKQHGRPFCSSGLTCRHPIIAGGSDNDRRRRHRAGGGYVTMMLADELRTRAPPARSAMPPRGARRQRDLAPPEAPMCAM